MRALGSFEPAPFARCLGAGFNGIARSLIDEGILMKDAFGLHWVFIDRGVLFLFSWINAWTLTAVGRPG